MKNVILFTALLMLAKPFWPVVEYAINYDYIISKLCENKDKPEMQCNGKCYLSKQLAKEAGESEENPFSNKQQKSEIPIILISESISEFTFATELFENPLDLIVYKPNLFSSLYISKKSPPPRVG